MAAPLPRAYGPYSLLKSLGQGAMGDVHLARPFNPDRGVPTPVVIKRLHGELATSPDFVKRFRHEADVAVSVDSPHVAKVYDVGAVGESLYIAMEYVPGWPLSKFLDSVIESGQHASIASIVDLIIGGLRGLHALHNAIDIKTKKPLGIIHRDISPKNLMVGEDGKMRIIDLGLGKSNAQDWKTRTGVIMGSVGYMPPEQVTAEKIDARADLYAMGVVLYEMLSLRNFIPRGPLPSMLKASLRPAYTPPSKHRPDVPPGLDEVVRIAISPEADDRYPDVMTFHDALRGVVPDRATEGGMVSLINDIYGVAKLHERHSELSQLMSLPMPFPPDEGPEIERTVVFVQREGVRPLTEEDLSPTRMSEMPQMSMVGTVAKTVAHSMRPGAMPSPMIMGGASIIQTPHGPAVVPPQGSLSGTGPDGGPMVSHLMSQSLVSPARQGVPFAVVGVMAAVIVVLLGTVGVLISKQGDDVRSIDPTPPASAGPAAVAAKPGPKEIEHPAPPPTPDPDPAEAAAAHAPDDGAASGHGKPRRKRTGDDTTAVAASLDHPAATPSAPGPAMAETPEDAKRKLADLADRLASRATQITTTDDGKKQSLIKIRVQLTQVKRSIESGAMEPGQAKSQLGELEKQLGALSAN